jgi:hypothetical protein
MFCFSLPGLEWHFSIVAILSLITSSISSSSNSPNICDISTTECNDPIFMNNIYANGLGYLVFSGHSDGTNSATWVTSPDLTSEYALWLLIVQEGWNEGYFLQYYITSDTSNLEIACDSSNPLQVVEYGSYTENFVPPNGWILGENNVLYFSSTCSNGLSNYLGSTPNNPYGALSFYQVTAAISTSAPESAGGAAVTVTQGEPVKTTISSGIVTSTSTIWVYVTQVSREHTFELRCIYL